ncbi:Uncharacterized protein Fot_56791 [Forsythia ovata]|uniref:Uncharacterized protein n=1 Tax=Forsythia ovata TaxID=205694 RepID=A0ABD1NYT5_9LAMI
MGQLQMGLSNSLTPDFDEQLVHKRHHIYWRNFNLAYDVPLEPTTQLALLRKDAYGPSKYIAMLQATKDIFREEGLQRFWQVLALLMVMPYTTIQFSVLHKLKTLAASSSSSKSEDHIHLSSGAKGIGPKLIQTVGSFIGGGSTIVALVHDGYGLQKIKPRYAFKPKEIRPREFQRLVVSDIKECACRAPDNPYDGLLLSDLAGGTTSIQQLKERLEKDLLEQQELKCWPVEMLLIGDSACWWHNINSTIERTPEKDLLEESPQTARVEVLASGNATGIQATISFVEKTKTCFEQMMRYNSKMSYSKGSSDSLKHLRSYWRPDCK